MTVEVTDKSAGVRLRLQSVVALLAGFAAVAVLSLAADTVFQMLGVYPAGREPMTSPCSVMRIWPCTAPCGCARIAW